MQRLAVLLFIGLMTFSACSSADVRKSDKTPEKAKTGTMELGTFSNSLAVKDIAASRAFYEKLGFEEVGGVQAQNWVVLQNGTTTIGLFQGMFPNNIMTFNPGWDHKKQTPESFKDVRDIQEDLKKAGITMSLEADVSTTGPASFMIVDPDGNAILFDQHVDKAK
ncbi:MAG: catechol 2,3-dioxygenase-like lactoylglutathione lyase family enzyme [Planctomycetota bacterium]|jgi:catechol 2,3-dioxygenase-like lactoylglutathione lyase family enzyme